MQNYHGPEGIFEAPSPIIPTYRPDSQSSKRSFTMSALAPKYQQYLSMADDIHSAPPPGLGSNAENVTDIVRLLQTHASSQGTSPSIGPIDMFKAGQRRLKLAFGNRKGTEPKIKSDDASPQLAALQQRGTFPKPQSRKWGHKRSVASTESSSKSASDLSFKSISKRDVEDIGRPWLDHPLERREKPGSKGSSALSSLDLRDLASYVEAAVNFSQVEDSEPPPYQPLTEQYSTPTATPNSARVGAQRASMAGPPVPKKEDMGRKANNDLPIASRFHRSAWKSNGNLKVDSFPKLPNTVAPQSSSNPSTSPRGSSAPTTPALKLFPDTVPSRTPSTKALRLPAGRSPTPNQSLFGPPASRSTAALAAAIESNKREYRNSSGSLPKIQENTSHAEKQLDSTKPRPAAIPRAKHKRRPSSLPPSSIEAFPMPAPSKPLPSVPEPDSRAQELSLDQQRRQVDRRQSNPDASSRNPPDISVSSPTTPGDCSGASRGRDSPFPRLIGTKDSAKTQSTAEPPIPIQPRRGSLGKAGRSREARVRSLIIRDLAKRRHQRSSSKDKILEEQLSPPHRIGAGSQLPRPCKNDGAQRQHQKKTSPRPSSKLAPSPLESNPKRQRQSRRYCSSPGGPMAAAIENFEILSRPPSSANLRVERKNHQLAVEKRGSTSMEHSLIEAETPIPSSDEEGPDGNFYRNAQRKAPARRRREKPAPLVIEKREPERGRSSKSHPATGSMESSTQHNYKKRAVEKASRMHLTPNYLFSEHHSIHVPEPKLNPSLEGRIEHLERQNKILQAALLAALDVGVKQDLSSLLGASPLASATPPLTGTSFSTETSVSDGSSVGQDHHSHSHSHSRLAKTPYRPDSWIASPGSLNNGSFDSGTSAEVKELEQMVDEFDLDWLSDRSSVIG